MQEFGAATNTIWFLKHLFKISLDYIIKLYSVHVYSKPEQVFICDTRVIAIRIGNKSTNKQTNKNM
jgi:hypothetical protein